MSAFASLGAAVESRYAHDEAAAAIRRRVQAMVEGGLLPQSALAAITDSPNTVHHPSGIPTVKRGRPAAEYVYNHTSKFPMIRQSMASKLTLGTGQISMGRARWNSDGASVFSVNDGKRLAQTPVKEPSTYERLRAARIQRAELETPLVKGIRLLPTFTPGRAFFWGSILAVWGTAATALSVSRQMGIRTPEDAPQAFAAVFSPAADFLRRSCEPLKEALHARVALPSGDGTVQQPEFARRLKQLFVAH